MIQTHNSVTNESNNFIKGRIKVVVGFNSLDENNKITGYTAGNNLINNDEGIVFIIDEFYLEHLEYCTLNIVDNKVLIEPIEGYELPEPILSEEDRQILELQQQIADLQALKEQQGTD